MTDQSVETACGSEGGPEPKKAGRYTPRDAVALGSTCPAPSVPPSPVLSALVGNNADLMEQVASLWIADTDIVVDATYGKGVFWRRLPNLPHHEFDMKTGHDCRALPLHDASVDVLVLDPPYRPTHGSRGFTSAIAGDYGLGSASLDSINDILDLYRDGLVEAARVLRAGGRVLVKTQDLTYNHRLHLVTLDVLALIRAAGFELADQFVLVNQARMPSSVWKKQERARRSHSILWVGVLGSPAVRSIAHPRTDVVTPSGGQS